MCGTCYSSIGPGLPHSCSQRTRHSNIISIIESLAEKEADQIISTLLRNKVKEIETRGSNHEMILSSLVGKPMRVVVNPSINSDETQLSADDIKNMQTNFNFTQNQTLGVARMIRASARKRKIIQPNLTTKLRNDLHSLDHFFETKRLEFQYVKKGKVTLLQNDVVFCKDVRGLIEFVKEKRQKKEVHLKIGVDGGGGFLKICLSIQCVGHDDSQQHTERVRQKYDDGPAAKKFRDNGVKKLFIIGMANVQENYHNVKALWSTIGIKNCEGTTATDLKLANILAGLMSHSSTHPCTYCIAKSGGLIESGELRTIGDISENYANWLESGGAPSTAKEFKNCVNEPIISDNIDDLILDLIPPPELHLMIGIVNTLFDHMVKEFGDEAFAWARACYGHRESKKGGHAFNGNGCKKLLDKVDILRSICSIGCLKYVEVFDNFRRVVDSCFGTELDIGFTTYIKNFMDSYLALEISVTPKAHIVFFHVPQFCTKYNKPLGFFNEQAIETIHFEFKSFWEKYKVEPDHKDYAKRLLKSISEINSFHL